MQTKYLCVLIRIGIKGESGLSPSVNSFTDRSKAVLFLWIFFVFSVLCLLCLCLCLFICFNSTSRYLDDLLNIDNPYFEQMVGQIYPTELQLNKANASDTEAPFFGFELVHNK